MTVFVRVLVCVAGMSVPLVSHAGVVCSLGASGNMRVCCDAGCGVNSVGCAGAVGNYQTGSQFPVGAACPSLSDRTGPFDSTEPVDPEAETTTKTDIAADYLREDVVSELWLTADEAPSSELLVLDAVEEIEGWAQEGSADQIEAGEFPSAFEGIAVAVSALLEAEQQGASVEQSVQVLVDTAFITMVSLIDDAVEVGVDAVEIESAWEAYDQAAAELFRVGGDPAAAVDILGKATGFGKGTKVSTSSASAKPQLL